jgi:hypothetical protein
MNELEQRDSAKRSDTPHWWYASRECSVCKSRSDYRIDSLPYQVQHLAYLSWIMRVVAVHNDQYVLIACCLHNVLDECPQAGP